MMRAFRHGIGALVACGLLAACSQPNLDELETYVARVKERPPGPLEPIPEPPQPYRFIYEPDNRRDPFVMDDRTAQATMPRQGTGIAPDPLRRREALENYSLDSLRMVGTLEQNDTRWGLVMSPDGILHKVGVGDHMGKNYGEIRSISAEGIALKEIVGVGPGGWRERDASLSLRQ